MIAPYRFLRENHNCTSLVHFLDLFFFPRPRTHHTILASSSATCQVLDAYVHMQIGVSSRVALHERREHEKNAANAHIVHVGFNTEMICSEKDDVSRHNSRKARSLADASQIFLDRPFRPGIQPHPLPISLPPTHILLS